MLLLIIMMPISVINILNTEFSFALCFHSVWLLYVLFLLGNNKTGGYKSLILFMSITELLGVQ